MVADPWNSPSPFIFDGPLPPSKLVGRVQEAATLREWARAGRFVALTAPRRFGKTSLIGKVASDAEEHDHIAVVVADLFEVASMADLVIRLERAWARHTPRRLRAAVTQAFAGSRVGLSLGGAGFSMALAERPHTDPLPALHALLDLPNKLTVGRNHARVLLVLDEFQSLGRVAGAEALVRSHAQHQREVASYMFAGSEPGMLAAAFGERARPFYGQVETFHLGRLGADELAAAIATGFESTEKHTGDVLAQLVATSEGHPQRAMLLAHLLWVQVRPGQVATDSDWAATLAAALHRVEPEAVALLSGLSTGERKTLRAVAEYGAPMASRALRTLDLAKTTARDAAMKLVADGVLEHEDGWRVVDPLLTRWIQTQMPTRGLPAL